MKRTIQLLLVLLLLAAFAGAAAAAPLAQEGDAEEGSVYIVQPGDYLMQLAREFLGDAHAFSRIVEATNARAATDSSFRAITNPNIILVGTRLWIPGVTDLPQAGTPGQTGPADTSPPGPMMDVAGTSWVLASLDGQDPLAETTVTLVFNDDMSAGGNSGCNGYGTEYELDGNRLTFGTTFGTLIACPEAIMAQEAAYLDMLANTAYFDMVGGQLRLFDETQTLLATFDPGQTSVEGTSWVAVNVNNGREAVTGVMEDTVLTAVFSEDGEINGSAGCNSFFGSYTAADGAIEIGPLASTRKLCPEEGVMEQEAAYLAALENATTYAFLGNDLELRDDDGALQVRFSPAE